MIKIETKKLLLMIFLIAFFWACCNENDNNSTNIITNIDLDQFGYLNVNIPDTGLIQTDSSYKTLVTSESLRDFMPYVDFTECSVLINFKIVNGRIYCDRMVLVDSINKTVTYSVLTKSCKCSGKCKEYDYNIVVVPKIDNNYKLNYK